GHRNGHVQQRVAIGCDVQVRFGVGAPKRVRVGGVHALEYTDHHYFDRRDLGNLEFRFQQLEAKRKAIITTEKDATRLELHRDFIREKRLPIFVLPLAVRFHFEEGEEFDALVREFMLNFRA
ncbi:MAG: tetraacyldisaccharide 4'-kinase, partial [Bacteroidota bacterium]